MTSWSDPAAPLQRIHPHLEAVLPARLSTRMLLGALLVGAAVAAVGAALLLAVSNLRETASDARHSASSTPLATFTFARFSRSMTTSVARAAVS